jgi:peroxiredoxin
MVRMTFAAMLAVGLLLAASNVHGQAKYNKKVKIGEPIPEFAGLPGVDGKSHSMSEYNDKDVLVIVVTGNDCPVAAAYEERIIAFTKKYASGKDSKVALVAINVNNNEANRLPRMVEHAKEIGFNFPYLYDESQKVGRAYGASVTPEFYVLNKQRKLVYTGTMDDNMNARKVKATYLEPAVNAALRGQAPDIAETRPYGCAIEYQK